MCQSVALENPGRCISWFSKKAMDTLIASVIGLSINTQQDGAEGNLMC